MAPRTTFANLTDGLQPLNLFDQALADASNLGVVQCTVTGTNALVLTTVATAFPPVIANISFFGVLTFVATNSSTGNVTAQVNGLPLLNVYRATATQAGNGDIAAGGLYGLLYSSQLNSGAGGYYLIGLSLGASNLAIGSQGITGGGTSTSIYGLLYNKNGVLGDTTLPVAQPLFLVAQGLPSGKSALTINNSAFVLPAFVNGEKSCLTLSGGQDFETQGETLLFFDTFGANSNGTILMSKSGGGSINTGSASGTTLTITAQSYGSIAVNQIVIGVGIPTGTIITSLGTGVGGLGTYILSNPATAASGSILTNDSPPHPTATKAAQGIGFFSAAGWYGNAPATRTFGVAIQKFRSDGDFTASSWPAAIDFFTTPVNTTVATLVFTIASNGSVVQTLNSIGTTNSDGVVLQNTTAATVGAQGQYSPVLRLTGQGWETNTSASQQVDWTIQNIAVPGTANPSTTLFFNYQINGAGYTSAMRLTSGGILNVLTGFQIAGAATSGNVLRGNGTNFISATLGATDLSNGVTGSGSVVLQTSPNFGGTVSGSTSTWSGTVTTPTLAGGSLSSSNLTLESTSGAGTTDTITFKTGSQAIAGFINASQQWTIGPSGTPVSGVAMTISKNTVIPSVAPTGTIAQLIGADGSNSTLHIVAAAGAPRIHYYASAGTIASPTASQSGDSLFANFGFGRGSTSYGLSSGTGFLGSASQIWTDSNQGSQLDIYTTPNNTAIQAISTRFQASGGVSIGTNSDPGIGLIYTNSASFIIRTKTSYTNGAGAQAGTLTNAPAAGNPTKWIPIDDNGTTRYIPAW